MTLKSSSLKVTFTSLLALSVFLPSSGCDLANNHTKIDRSTNSEFQDFRDAMAPREAGYGDASVADDIPDLQPYVSESVEKLPPMPLVSISINQSVPLREALFELAKQADYDIELDPRISGSVIFTARNRPMDVVIDRICEISGLRYKFDENTLRIELDTPYSKNYKIDYLSFVRKNSGSMKTDVSVASSSGDSGGVSGGSKFSVDTTSDSDFWSELDANIKQILESNATGSYLKTAEDPQITLTTAGPTNPPVPPIDAAALQDGTAAASVTPQAGAEYYVTSPMSLPADNQPVSAPGTVPAPVDPSLTVDTSSTPVQAAATPSGEPVAATPSSVPLEGSGATGAAVTPPPTLRIESLPTSAAAGNNSNLNEVSFTPSYSMNKQAGIISVYANERLHKKINEYLTELRRSTTSQVLIEAKVLEVSLTDEFATGINWDLLDRVGDFSLTGTFAKPSFSVASTGGVTFGFAGDDISSFVDALSRFGTVHALASPRLTVLNNQSAVLNVAKNQVYFELDVDSDTTSDGTNQTVSLTVNSDIKTVPEGVLINVLPSINLDRRSVSMQLRPTITKINDYVSDPGVAYVAQQNSVDIESLIPVVNVQEVDSVLDMKSGQMMVMGGLLQDTSSSTQEGVPIASEIPVFGGLFRSQSDSIRKTELVIFLKATILDDSGQSIHQTDRDLYKIFSQDRRAEKM
ncbi:MAG TPA: type II and III secretion system family protein [Alphaproteobacteria bacterium]|nr:type II and III secretion system family protein [Alphaproteobacteria bacterium]